MLSFGALKCHVLESIHEQVDCNLDEEEAFVLLESILEDDEPIDQDILLHKQHRLDLLEMKKLEDAAFTLLEMVVDDDDEPIDEEILFPVHKRNLRRSPPPNASTKAEEFTCWWLQQRVPTG